MMVPIVPMARRLTGQVGTGTLFPMTPLQFTRSVRGLNRLRRIAQVLTQHGFGHIVAQVNLTRFVPVWMMRKKATPRSIKDGTSHIGRSFAAVCSDLGPTFIKLGQLISMRPDIVPQEIRSELLALQDDVPPFDTSVAMDMMAEEFGRPVDQCFASIERTPRASGSIGQVYSATGLDGTELVVKVRRPGVDEIIKLDMQVLRWLAESLERLMPEFRVYRPTMLVAELEQMLTSELDYINEASATTRFADAFAEDPGIQIPRVYWEWTGPRVLTLEALSGTNIDRLLSDASHPIDILDRRRIARRIAVCYLRQVFELGMFHADPHPGNILIERGTVIGLIDFGQVGTITDELMTDLLALTYACVNREVGIVVDTLADMGALSADTDRRSLSRALLLLLNKYYGLPIKRLNLNTLLVEFSDLIRRHDVVIPQDLSLLTKALGMAAATVARLDPELNLLELAGPRIRRRLRERFSPPRLARGAAVAGWDLFQTLRRAPGQLRAAMRALASGWRVYIRHENLDQLVRELDRSSNRLAFAIVIAAIIIGSSVVISANTDLTLFHLKVQHLGLVGYIIAGILGLGLSWAIYRSGRLH